MTGSPQVVLAGAGMTAFRRAGRRIRELAQEAVAAALADAGARVDQIQYVAFANAVAGLITGQEMVRSQSALRHTGLLGATIISVEAACASGAAALHTALEAVRSGAADVAMALGAERLTSAARSETFAAIGTAMLSGRDSEPGPRAVEQAAARAFADASVDPADVDVAEVHDGTAPGELISIEQLGLAGPGGALGWLHDGTLALGGRCPINPSGGLLCRGHPIGATGTAQMVELARQLSGRTGARQVPGARVAVAESAGGWIGTDSAAAAVTVLSR